jgi:hypothetical protein
VERSGGAPESKLFASSSGPSSRISVKTILCCIEIHGDNGGNEGSEGQKMSACEDDDNDNDNDNDVRSTHPRSHIINGSSRSSSLNNQGGVVTLPAQHLCLSEALYR